MNRRSFVVATGASVSAVSLSGCFGGNDENNQESDSETQRRIVDNKDVPSNVRKTREVAEEYHSELNKYYEDFRIFIRQNGEIVIEYKENVNSSEALESELYRIADLFLDVVDDEEDARTVSVVGGRVQLILPKPPVVAYINGELERDAVHETMEITSVNR